MKPYKDLPSDIKGRMSITQKASYIKTYNKRLDSKRRLEPVHGDDWVRVYRDSLREDAELFQLELQISNMPTKEVALWIHKLRKEK
ncbi:conserved hypothetical protein [Vibrio phage 495E54-1]|nr:conserved hypothetical protein [Vibrio phage 495E54-1]